jgi:recombination protein RecT
MTDTALATVAETANKHPLVLLRERLEARSNELEKMLPSDVKPERFIRAAISAATLNPEIQACTFKSIWDACISASRYGLLPDGIEGAIVPFKSKASFLPMYQGLLRCFRRSGQYRWLTANVIRQGEEFIRYVDEQGEHFRHSPGLNFEAPIIAVYALARTIDDVTFAAVLPIAEANKIKNKSRAQRDDAPWREWESEMLKKTAIKRLLKLLPSARDIIPEDDEPDNDESQMAPAIEQPRRATGATAALQAFAGSPPASETFDPGTDAVLEEGGAQDQCDSQSAEMPTDGATISDSAAADKIPDASDSHFRAYEHGKLAKAAGEQRRVPKEYYQAPDSAGLARSWLAGWDGRRL